jgi:PilZ domain
MEERRQLARHAVLKRAKIAFDNQPSLFDCTVCNITSEGACLNFAAASPADESFALSFDNFRSTRACRVIWRQADKLGVCFG